MESNTLCQRRRRKPLRALICSWIYRHRKRFLEIGRSAHIVFMQCRQYFTGLGSSIFHWAVSISWCLCLCLASCIIFFVWIQGQHQFLNCNRGLLACWMVIVLFSSPAFYGLATIEPGSRFWIDGKRVGGLQQQGWLFWRWLGWLSVKYCRWAPGELAFCNGQTFHSPRPTHPLLHCSQHLAPLSTLKSEQSNALQQAVQASSARLELKTDNFPNFPNFSPNFSRKLRGGWGGEYWTDFEVGQNWIHQVTLSGGAVQTNHWCKI